MKGLREKFQKNGGFTLVEMLIVVAIIAILVAVSIPLVTTSLDKARQGTDDANLRAAKAEAMIMYMNDQINGKIGATDASIKTNDYYDIVNGTFVTGTPAKGYNKSGLGTTPATAADSTYIIVTITPGDVTNPVSVAWKTS